MTKNDEVEVADRPVAVVKVKKVKKNKIIKKKTEIKNDELLLKDKLNDENSSLLDLYGIDSSLLEDIEQSRHETQWRNKQRVLIVGTRKMTARHRHLMEDIKRLLPHHKPSPKVSKSEPVSTLVTDAADLNCNTIIHLENRQRNQLRMYLARCPNGPTIVFDVYSIHTTGELHFSGNHLMHSRPLLIFDKMFDQQEELKLSKELLIQTFGTPRNHPKAKPFHDHVLSFMIIDGVIIVRHYQIFGDVPDDVMNQTLTEIGPRFALGVNRVLSGPMGGDVVFSSELNRRRK